jgi:hypothetical protein
LKRFVHLILVHPEHIFGNEGEKDRILSEKEDQPQFPLALFFEKGLQCLVFCGIVPL